MAGPYQIRMPQLGETVAEGTVSTWLKRPGDAVNEREPVLEVSTDKVDTEVESTVAGVLSRILVEEGATVPVGTPLAEVAAHGQTAAEPEPSPEAPAAAPAPSTSPAAPSGSAPDHPTRAAGDTAPALSPRVRRMIAEHGIDTGELMAFAEGRRVDRRTVEAFLARRDAGVRRVPFSTMRGRVAARMRDSLARAAHVVTAMEVDFTAVAEARRTVEHPPTWLAFVAWAMSRTLPGFERLNATVEESDTGEASALAVHASVHLGVAVDLDGEGLIVPVVRHTHTMDVAGLAAEIARVSRAARAGELTPDDVAGATCTISGQGPHGTLFTVPIINQPQVATLSVDGITRRPAVVGHGEQERVEARDLGVLALSWDHRAIDGLYAARFLAALRDTLQDTDFSAQVSTERGR